MAGIAKRLDDQDAYQRTLAGLGAMARHKWRERTGLDRVSKPTVKVGRSISPLTTFFLTDFYARPRAYLIIEEWNQNEALALAKRLVDAPRWTTIRMAIGASKLWRTMIGVRDADGVAEEIAEVFRVVGRPGRYSAQVHAVEGETGPVEPIEVVLTMM